jgi:hypothetical protein
MRPASTLKMLLLNVLLTQVAFAGQGTPNPVFPAQLTFIVETMERAQSEISIPNHVVRDYRLSRPDSARVDSDVIAEVDFRSPGLYVVKRRSGSSRGEQVVKRILEHEIAVDTSSRKSRAAAVTRENYVFSYLGETVLDGHSYYLLHLDPKRKQPELISGQVWVDKRSYLIRRIEGEIAKSPSWWVKKVHVRLDFASPRRMWIQSSMEAVADVRCVGPQKLTSHVLNYGAPNLVPAKSEDEADISEPAAHEGQTNGAGPSRRPFPK